MPLTRFSEARLIPFATAIKSQSVKADAYHDREYRPHIDGLRAVAVLIVVLYHAFPNRLPGGYVGVDVFFVISGFLISGIIFRDLNDGRFSYLEFQIRRIKRIFPALLVVLISVLVFSYFFLLATEYRNLGKHVAAAAAFVPNFAFWNESGYFASAVELKPLLHLWSLGIEEQFYIFWPVMLAAVWNRRRRVSSLLLTVGATSFVANLVMTNTMPTGAFYSPLSRFWELMIGATLAYASLRWPQRFSNYANVRSAIGLALIGFCSLTLHNHTSFPGWWAVLPTVGAALVISGGNRSWLNQELLSASGLVWLGMISYPLYLWHWPLISLAWILGDGAPSASTRATLICLATILAAGTYFFVERPIQQSASKYFYAKLLVVAMVLIGFSGLGVYLADGLKSRVVNGNPAGFAFDFQSDKNFGRCFLNEGDKPQFDPACDGRAQNSNRPLVLVWGDSHAQSLALGLPKQSKGGNFDVAEFTASACPPIIGFEEIVRPQCREINQLVSDKIRSLKPHTVILSAFWYLYNGFDGYSTLDYRKFAETVRFLKEQGVKNIIIAGQLPTFLIDQPKVGNRTFVSGKIDRTLYKFNFDSAALDDKIRAFAANNGVNFLSAMDLMCNTNGCLISASPKTLVPLAFDYGHLTPAGADYIFDRAISQRLISLP